MVTNIKPRVFLLVVLTIFIISRLPSTQVHAEELQNNFPYLSSFIKSVKDGNANSLRGVYVRNKIAFQITQQPLGNPAFVSNETHLVTQFSMASEVGNIGLLAHNHLAGANFSQLEKDDIIFLVYGDGHTQKFAVDDIQAYRATDPFSPYSHFENLTTEELLSAEQLFNKVYRGQFHLTLQTCIEKNSNLSWGRLFIIATPMSKTPIKFWHQNILER
jgi:hypothetical protein